MLLDYIKYAEGKNELSNKEFLNFGKNNQMKVVNKRK